MVQGTLEKMWDYLGREGMGCMCGKGRLHFKQLKATKRLLVTTDCNIQKSVAYSEEFHECMGMCGRCGALREYAVANQESKNS